MLERERLESKKISKTNAVTSIMDHELPAERRLHRPVGLRAVADRPQVGAHPRRGPGLRRRAAERRAEARGVGLAELGGHRDRRRALLQARAQPRRRRPARRTVLLPDEVAAQPAPRRPGARATRRSSSPSTRGSRARARKARARPPGAGDRKPSRRSSRPGQAGRRAAPSRRSARECAAAVAAHVAANLVTSMPATFSIAHVTPYPWEAEDNEVNAHVAPRRRRALAARAPRADRSRRRARRSACATRAGRCAPRAGDAAALLEGTDQRRPARDRRRRGARRRPARRRAPAPVALPIDVARTVEELLGTVELDFVHVHEPFAPSTVQRGAAPLARAERRLLPLLRRAAALDAARAPLRRELLRPPRRAHREPPGHGRADGAPLPGRVPADRRRGRRRRRGAGARSTGSSPRAGTPRAATSSCGACSRSGR